MRIEFEVHGIPQPQGSTRAFLNKTTGRAAITTDNVKLKPWRQEVATLAMVAMAEQLPHNLKFLDAVYVECQFRFQRPKSLAKRVTQKITKPDIDKLLRGLLDSLTGIVFRDDSQVVGCNVVKEFSDNPGCTVVVRESHHD